VAKLAKMIDQTRVSVVGVMALRVGLSALPARLLDQLSALF